MKNDFLNEKRQRDKDEILDEVDKDMEIKESVKVKKPKLEDLNKESSDNNISNGKNNFDFIDSSELAFKYNSINTNIKCKICEKDITNNIKFYCDICADFIFCLNCFITSDHAKKHDYHIIDNLNFPLFTEDWTANEEHKLISTISKSGLNNWEEICKSMDNKGQVECESHYYSFYNINKDNPLPLENQIILDENKQKKDAQISINKTISEEMLIFCNSNAGISLEKENENSLKNNTNTRSLCIRKNSRGNVAESISEILGVRPLRNEFDNEFLNDSEIELSHLEFDDKGKENEKDLCTKMEILKDYNLILKEREKRKKFIFDKGLVDLRRQNRIESKLSKEEYDLLMFMRPFHRFFENSDFFDQFESIIIEQQLKLMLKTINKLENEKNSKGGKISTLEDIEKYFEIDKNTNKGRKHNNHEHNKEKEKEKEKEKDNNNEKNLLANKIERHYQFNKISKEKKMEEIFEEDEFKLVKEMPLARSTFYDIKIKINEIANIFESKKNEKSENFKEKIENLLEQYGLEKQTYMDLFDFYCKKYNHLITINEKELKDEKEQKKGKKDNEVTYIEETEELKSESVKSNKNRNKIKKAKEKKNKKKMNIKGKKKVILDDSMKVENNNESKMDIEMEQSKENNSEETSKNKKKEEENKDIKNKEKENSKKIEKDNEIKDNIKEKENENKETKNNENENKNEGINNNKELIIEETKNENIKENKSIEDKEIIIEKTNIKYYEN